MCEDCTLFGIQRYNELQHNRGILHFDGNIDHAENVNERKKKFEMIGQNLTEQEKGERKVIMATNAVGQETMSANFCLAFGFSNS